MKVLLIGSGGREHAIAHALVASPLLEQLYVAPGNGGTAALPKTENVDIKDKALDDLVSFARDHAIDLTVVGPEAPLVAGVVDRFRAAGLAIFGPTQAAAQLEGSKAFSKAFMLRHNIPTGRAETFDDIDAAMRYLRQLDSTPVVKASGLAGGKGVVLPPSREAAAATVASMMLDHRFGDAGNTILIEERLSGPEVSVLAFSDGKSVRMMPPAQDHKRLLDGDNGPNTGGMGAFAPSPLFNAEALALAERNILLPTVRGMAAEGMPFVGVLYAGLMLTSQGPKVLEFNARFGDPETQSILPLIEGDLVEYLLWTDGGRADFPLIKAETAKLVPYRRGSVVNIVIAAAGYPGAFTKDIPLIFPEHKSKDLHVTGAGIREHQGSYLSTGGRIANVVAYGKDRATARALAYEYLAAFTAANPASREKLYWREDIAQNT